MWSRRFRPAWLMAPVVLTVAVCRPVVAGEPIPARYLYHARQAGVPPAIWFALLKQESCVPVQTGRCLPWPWTANIDGRGYRYPDSRRAAEHIKAAIRRGRSVDIGLGQLHYRSHGQAFATVEGMLGIDANLAYSAAFLKQQYQQTGDWWDAVGRYHAPNHPARAAAYRQKVYTRWRALHG